MNSGKKHSGLGNFFGLLLLGFILAGCRDERPPVAVVTPTPAPTIVSTSEIDPAIATALAQITPTLTVTATVEAHEGATPSTTLTPEFICEPPDGWVAYAVQQGDTLIALAGALGISVGEIKSANCKLDDALAVGEILYLPVQPPIPQPPPVFQQPPPSVNTIQEEPESLTQEIVKELNFFGGGGVPPFLSDKCISNEEPGVIVVSEQNGFMFYDPFSERFTLEIIICDPETLAFSTTMLLPTGEAIQLERLLPPIYEAVPADLEDATNVDAVASLYNLPLAHDYGTYTFVIKDYPEPGMIIEKPIEVSKGFPTMSSGGDGLQETFTLFYFEPRETIQLAAYKLENEYSGQADFVTSQTYQVNEEGNLILEFEAGVWPEGTRFAVYGEKSGFVSDSLGSTLWITNRGTVPLCQISLAPTGTTDWRAYKLRLMTAEDYDSFNVLPDRYDIEIRDCDGNVFVFHEDVDLRESLLLDIPLAQG